MKKDDKLSLLQDGLQQLDQAAEYLELSRSRTEKILRQESWTPEELERLEALTSRFARLSDLMLQKVMRSVDELELVAGGTLLDRIQRAEKRGWVDSADDLLQIRELRNLIAHEYATDKIAEIYRTVALLTPKLVQVVPKIRLYAEQIMRQYPQTDKTAG